jgi:glucokinase
MFTTVSVLNYIFICNNVVTESSPAVMTNCTLLARRQALVLGQLIPLQALLLLINDFAAAAAALYQCQHIHTGSVAAP